MPSPLLSLLVLKVRDLEACCAFYSSIGLQLVRERHGRGPEHVSANAGGHVLLELYPANADTPTPQVRLGFTVTSVEATISAVLQAGGTLISPPVQGEWGLRAVVFDPEGHRVEFVEATAGVDSESSKPNAVET